MQQYILAFDQGTTSSRAIVFDKSGSIVWHLGRKRCQTGRHQRHLPEKRLRFRRCAQVNSRPVYPATALDLKAVPFDSDGNMMALLVNYGHHNQPTGKEHIMLRFDYTTSLRRLGGRKRRTGNGEN